MRQNIYYTVVLRGLTTRTININTLFYKQATLFFNSASVLRNFFMKWAVNVGIVCTHPLPILLGGGGFEPPTKFSKKGGAWQDLSF